MDNQSILFVADAEEMLNNEDISSAIDLCKKGIAQFPDYPLGYFILAKSYCKIEDLINARTLIEDALNRFPTNKLIKNLHADLLISPEIQYSEDTKPLDSNTENESIDNESDVESIDELVTEDIIVEDDVSANDLSDFQPSNDKISESESENYIKIDQENFLKLVVSYDSQDTNSNTIKSGNIALIPGLNYTPLRARSRQSSETGDKHIPMFPDFSIHFSENILHLKSYNEFPDDSSIDDSEELLNTSQLIVSDTYASILVAQGAYTQALETYQELCSRHPEKSEIYNKKIEELQLML